MTLLMPLVITPPSSSPQFSLVQLIPLILVLPLIAFWAWMFRDMLNNDSLPDDAKNGWTIAFILLNVFAAVIYYAMIYRNRD
jgi:cbb3-type cytochrome oxidase subunit 3